MSVGIQSSQAFVPNKVTGLKLWTDSSDEAFTVSAAGFVSRLNDKGPDGNDLLQATNSKQPIVQPDGSILFDGVDDDLKTASFLLEQPTTVYILLKQITYTNFRSFIDGDITGGGLMGQQSNPPQLRAFAGTNLQPVNSSALNVYDVITIIFNSFSSVFQVNNDSPLLGSTGINDMNGLTLGAQANESFGSNIQVKEVIVFNTAHDAAQRDIIIAYLTGKSIPFVPSDFPGLQMEMDSLEPGPDTIIAGGLMSQWGDKSGNGNHLIQAVGIQQPAVQGDGSILFDGFNDFMKAIPFTLVQPTTVYILLQQITFAASGNFVDGNTAGGGIIRQIVPLPSINAFAGVNSATRDTSGLGIYDVILAVFNGVSSVLQVNNETPLTGSFGTNSMNGFTLGAQGGGASPSNIQVKAILTYNTAHNAAQRKVVVDYLNNRYA